MERAAILDHWSPASGILIRRRGFLAETEHNALDPRWLKSDESSRAGTNLSRKRGARTTTAFYRIDSDNNLAVHPSSDAAIIEATATGATFATESELSEAKALWPASRPVEVWNHFARAPPFADLKAVKKFTDRRTAAMRIWTVAQRPDQSLEEEMNIAEQDMLRAKQEMLSITMAAKPAKVARTAAPKAPAKPKATKGATTTDGAPAPKHREGTRKATVIVLLERAGGAALDEIMAETARQKHSVRGFISTTGRKHGYMVTSTPREADMGRVYSIAK